MRLCVSLFRGAAAPLGCVIFSVSVEIAACTHSALREKSHTRAYTAKHGAFWVGALSLPSERSARFGNPAWPGLKTANFAAFGSWSGGALEERRKPSGQRCAYARRCSEASRPRWAALPCCRCSFSMTCLDSGIERLDQAFRQSYYHTQLTERAAVWRLCGNRFGQ